MSKYQEVVKAVATKLVAKMIDHDTYEWPPKCALITYQPMRPNCVNNSKQAECTESEGNNL